MSYFLFLQATNMHKSGKSGNYGVTLVLRICAAAENASWYACSHGIGIGQHGIENVGTESGWLLKIQSISPSILPKGGGIFITLPEIITLLTYIPSPSEKKGD